MKKNAEGASYTYVQPVQHQRGQWPTMESGSKLRLLNTDGTRMPESGPITFNGDVENYLAAQSSLVAEWTLAQFD